MQDVGDGKGLYYSLNIPLKDGITTQQYVSLFQRYDMLLLTACAIFHAPSVFYEFTNFTICTSCKRS